MTFISILYSQKKDSCVSIMLPWCTKSRIEDAEHQATSITNASLLINIPVLSQKIPLQDVLTYVPFEIA